MNNLETPLDFSKNKNLNGNIIQYINLMELCQGCPETGNIMINNNIINNHKFGGPLFEYKNDIFLPIYTKTLFKRGFKVARINLKTLEITKFGSITNFVYFDKIENNKIYYYSDIKKQKLCIIDLDK